MISQLSFETARLFVENWTAYLRDPAKRKKLEQELKDILTPQVTHRLPLSMQISVDHDSISKWVDDRDDEVTMLCVHARDTLELVGLIILIDTPENAIPTIHLGYIIGETNWGKGYATEMIKALVLVLGSGSRINLAAGVDRDNVASVKVLEKSSFKKISEQTTAGRFYIELIVNLL